MDDLMAGPTRCLLVQPGFSGNSFFNFSNVARLVGARYTAAPLGLMTVAALLPQHWQFKLIDENVEPLTDAHLDRAQVVMTGGMLPQQQNIFTIAQRARAMGKPVVVGGPDPTQQPHLYVDADYLVLGEGEVTIPHFLADLSRGAASGVYRSDERADMAQSVVPRFDLIRFTDYMRVGIQFSRGCPYNCEFCDIIELFGRRPRTKPAEHILAELQALYDLGYRGHVDFVDDNFIGNKAHVINVLEAIRDWSARHDYPFYFSTEASINLAKEEKLLRLMHENDFRYVFVGIESPDEDVLAGTQKKQNRRVCVTDAVRTLSEHGMIVNGGFILGFDGETEHTARRMIDLIQEAGIATAMVGMLTALPNTQLSRRLEREGRLFSAEGLRITDAAQDIDNTTSGLNFASQRPRVDILRDHSEVLRTVYSPRHYFDRVRTTALTLRSNRRYRPAFGESLRRVWAFIQVCLSVGLNPRTGPAYWRTLFAVLARRPASVGTAVSMSALYMHFGKQADYVTGMLEERVAQVLRYGEEHYNRIMVATRHAESG
jgi:radical SAM superfamily enzyme YgiQ (UPF0313 family)